MMKELVRAALTAAEQRGQDVADVPLTAIAAAAGMSRSTLIRRLGGRRQALDDAVRAAGVEPGGRAPVRERAVSVAAQLIAERGLNALTMAAVAAGTGCSLPALHGAFDGRDGLLNAVFDRYVPIGELEAMADNAPPDLRDTVMAIHRMLAVALTEEPRVFPAVLADAFGRLDSPTTRSLRVRLPRLLSAFTALVQPHVRDGRLRPLPLPLLVQLLLGPLVTHLMLRPVLELALSDPMPPVEESCQAFTDAFLRAAALPPSVR